MQTIEAVADPVATGIETKDTMKALVYGGPGQRAWQQSKPKPMVRDPGDAVVRITTTTICGTDLHIMKGDVPCPASVPDNGRWDFSAPERSGVP